MKFRSKFRKEASTYAVSYTHLDVYKRQGLADMLKKDELPIFNWVWFGLYRSEGGLNGYT